jgi:hypothetical protein
MRVSYKLSEKDLLEARGKHGGPWIKLIPIIGILLVASGLGSLVPSSRQFPSAAGSIAMGLFLLFFLRLQVWLSFRRDTRLQDQFEAAISDSGIDVSSSTATSTYSWSAFTRYAETKNLFLVYQSPQAFNVFPKRSFGLQEANEFRSLLDQKLGSASVAHRKRISPQTWIFLVVVALAAILLVMAIRNIR